MDITETKEAQDDLQKSREFLDKIINTSPTLIYVKDLEGKYQVVNEKFTAAVGLPREQILGKKASDILDADRARKTIREDKVVQETNTVTVTEEDLLVDDEIRTFFKHKFPIHNEKGEIIAVGGSATDITERKRMEEALNSSEAKFERIFENMGEGYLLWDMAGGILSVNPSGVQILGYSVDAEILIHNVKEIFKTQKILRNCWINFTKKEKLEISRSNF